MYTKFIRSFNSFFGKKGNYIFSGFLVILSILLIGCSIYAFFNLNIRDKRFVERYVYFRDEKAYYIDNDGELEYQMFGDDMQDAIGKEVKKLIDIAYRDAQEILKQNVETLHAIAKELMAKEKINEQEFNKFFMN